MSNISLPATELVSFAHRLGDESATAILPHFRSDLIVDSKSSTRSTFDPVTIADKAAEDVIRSMIIDTYPDDGILGEEQATRPGNSGRQWVIDPIDGTRAFILGLPTWGTLIGLEIDDVPTIGLMSQPFTLDRFWSDGSASYFRGQDGIARKIQTRTDVSLSDAQMACTHPEMFAEGKESAVYETINRQVRSCRLGTDCFGYAMLAAGRVDLVIEADLKPYDIVALIPIIQNAGGVVTTWDGADARHGGRIVAAGSVALHAEALDAIANVQAA